MGNEKAGTMFIVPVAAIPKEGLQGWRRGVTRGRCIAVGLDPHRNRPRSEIAIRWMLYSSFDDAVPVAVAREPVAPSRIAHGRGNRRTASKLAFGSQDFEPARRFPKDSPAALYFGSGRQAPLRPVPLRLDHLVADCVAHELADRVQVELAHQVGAMRLGGLDADVQRHRHFLVALALGEQLHDLALAGR